MTDYNEKRRAFMIGAAAGAGVVAGAALAPQASAQIQGDAATPSTNSRAGGAGHGAFFNDEDAATVAAFTERLMPGAPGKPGARDADVQNYIDLALAGAYADLQEFYRHGLTQLEAYCRGTYNQGFASLKPAQQDETIAALESGRATGFVWPTAHAFFNMLRTHTMEGMFADPIYGGNRDFAGWRLVGFPGAQPAYGPADLRSKQSFGGAPMMGLHAQGKTPMRKT